MTIAFFYFFFFDTSPVAKVLVESRKDSYTLEEPVRIAYNVEEYRKCRFGRIVHLISGQDVLNITDNVGININNATSGFTVVGNKKNFEIVVPVRLGEGTWYYTGEIDYYCNPIRPVQVKSSNTSKFEIVKGR